MRERVAEASARFDVHGVGVRALSPDPRVLEELARDFSYFAGETAPRPDDVVVRLHAAPAPPGLLGGRWWPGRGLRWRSDGGARIVRYDDGGLTRWSEAEGAGDIYCERPHRLHELAYLLILSRAGERLDLSGLHRVHALGFEHRGRGGLVLLPSGGGKTSLSLALRGADGVRFLSEDTPLVAADGRLLAFPLRWGLRSREDASGIPAELVRPFERRRHGLKWLIDVEHFKGRLAGQARPRWVFVGRRAPGRPASITPIAAPRAAGALALNLVVGWGVPQMAEYALSWPAAPRLAGIAVRRAAAALRLLRAASCQRFELGRGPEEAAGALLEFLERA